MKHALIAALALTVAPAAALAQVPVHDKETYREAATTARQTKDLLDVSRNTLQTVKETLEAVTGQRQDASSLANLAIGQGFSVSQMPSLGQLASGGTFSWGSIGTNFAQNASGFIQGLNLIARLTGSEGNKLGTDQSYETAVHAIAALTAMIDGSGAATQARQSSFEQAASRIGQAQDVKGSLDQNTQVQIQSGLTVNELIGVMNGAVTALNSQNLNHVTEQAAAARAMQYNANQSWPQ